MSKSSLSNAPLTGKLYEAVSEVEQKLQPTALERDEKLSTFLSQHWWVPIALLLSPEKYSSKFWERVLAILKNFSEHVNVDLAYLTVQPRKWNKRRRKYGLFWIHSLYWNYYETEYMSRLFGAWLNKTMRETALSEDSRWHQRDPVNGKNEENGEESVEVNKCEQLQEASPLYSTPKRYTRRRPTCGDRNNHVISESDKKLFENPYAVLSIANDSESDHSD